MVEATFLIINKQSHIISGHFRVIRCLNNMMRWYVTEDHCSSGILEWSALRGNKTLEISALRSQ